MSDKDVVGYGPSGDKGRLMSRDKLIQKRLKMFGEDLCDHLIMSGAKSDRSIVGHSFRSVYLWDEADMCRILPTV